MSYMSYLLIDFCSKTFNKANTKTKTVSFDLFGFCSSQLCFLWQKYCGAYSILLFVGTSALFFMFFFFLQPETMRSFAKEKEETQNTVEGPEERVIVCNEERQ